MSEKQRGNSAKVAMNAMGNQSRVGLNLAYFLLTSFAKILPEKSRSPGAARSRGDVFVRGR